MLCDKIRLIRMQLFDTHTTGQGPALMPCPNAAKHTKLLGLGNSAALSA